MNKFNSKHACQIKNTAKSIDMYVVKKAKLEAKIQELEKEIEECDNNIALWEAPILNMTGYHIEDLVYKERVLSSVKDGKEIYKYEFKLKYPETIIPNNTEEINGEEF